MRLINIIEAVMDIAFTVFAIYGIFVLRKWHKVAVKTDAVMDEMREEINGNELEDMTALNPCDHELDWCEYYYDDDWGYKGRHIFGSKNRVGYLCYCKKCGTLFVNWGASDEEREEGADL